MTDIYDQLARAMLVRVNQEREFGELIDRVYEAATTMNDEQRVASAKAIASALCAFMRAYTIDRHERGLPLNQETRKPALSLVQYVRLSAMERLNVHPGQRRVVISGFQDRPRDPYAHRSMYAGFESPFASSFDE